jgi:hypothetical protein
MRAVAGIIVGLVVGFLVTIVIGIVAVGAAVGAAPGQGDVNLSDPNLIVEIFAEMPLGAKLALMAAWFGGAFAGAAIGKLIARRGWVAWTIAGLMAAYVVANVLILPMPGWMQALSVLAPLLGGLLANHFVASSNPAAAPETEHQELAERAEN